MKIVFDFRHALASQIDGTTRYAINLISHVLQLDPVNEYFCIGNQAILSQHVALPSFPNVQIIPKPHTHVPGQNFFFLYRTIQQLGADIFHVPHYLVSPLGGKYKKILTVFDLIPLLFPHQIKPLLWRKVFYKTPYPTALLLRAADKVIAVSEHTKQDIMWLLHVPSEKIQVVWIGIDSCFKPDYRIPALFFEKYRLPPRFLLYVGRQVPYKGVQYLIQGYALLSASLRQEYKLVIAGMIYYTYFGELQAVIQKYRLEKDVIFLDYIPEADLPLLYSAATLLVHPSLYEGFGLPPLEAMACGTPVVYADTSSMTELIGKAGVSVTPASPEALAEGIRTLLEDQQLRESYAVKGIQHVQRYAWQEVAQQTLQLYRELGN